MTIFSHAIASMLGYTVLFKSGKASSLQQVKVSSLFLLMLFGALPDLPLTFLVITGSYDPHRHFHHTWITHTPIFWIVIALGVAYFSREVAHKLLFGTWLHLAMDWYGGGDGIMFLYPLSTHQYGVLLSGVHGKEGLKIYFSHWYFLAFEIFLWTAGLFFLFWQYCSFFKQSTFKEQ